MVGDHARLSDWTNHRRSRRFGGTGGQLLQRFEVLYRNLSPRSALALGAFLAFSIGPAAAGDPPPAMSLPGQFNVSATGAATYAIPLAVPPGSGGMVPSIALNYSSQGSDGIMGWGWTMGGLPSIGRCARNPAQDAGVHGGVNYNNDDRYCMEGQRLIAISGAYGANGTQYRTELEGFSQIISYGATTYGPAYFVAWTKSGQMMEFGNTPDSQIMAVGGAGIVRSWGVDKISDTKGDYLTVTYNGATSTERLVYGEGYPVEIDYTGNANASPAVVPYNSVKFVYNMARPDQTPRYQAGALQQNTVLLTDVKTYLGTTGTTTLVYDYKLAYAPGTSGHHSELTSVTLCGGVDTCAAPCTGATNCLASTSFGWQGSRDAVTMTPVSNTIVQGNSQGTNNILPAELNGDGLADFMLSNSPTQCESYVGNPDGTFTTGTIATITQECTAYKQFAVWDFNGDGFSDVFSAVVNWNKGFTRDNLLQNLGNGQVLHVVQDPTVYYPITGDFNGDGRTDVWEQWDPNIGNSYISDGTGHFAIDGGETAAGSNFNDSAADFDGDGCTDILTQGSPSAIIYFCNPAMSRATVPHWTDSEVVFGDFNGDGKTDILVAKPSAAGTLYLSTGTGLYTTSYSVPSGWGKYAIYTGDFDGDGRTDLLLVAPGSSGAYGVGTTHKVMLSTGTGFVQVATITNSDSRDGGCGAYACVNATVADWNNDGASDIWLKKPSGDVQEMFSFVPEMIKTISNGVGSTTTVTYDRLNKNGSLYQKCATAGNYYCGDAYPTLDVDGPMYVVSRVDAGNAVGGTYGSTYAYGQGKIDQSGRGFLGFSQMSVTDLQTGIVQTTNYLTAFPYIGLIASQTKIGCSGVTLNSTTNTYGANNLGATRTFVYLATSAVATTDCNGAPLPTVTTSYLNTDGTAAYDAYGNSTRVTQTTQMPDGSDTSTRIAINTYDNDTTYSHWFLGRLRTANVESVAGSSDITRQTAYTYDTGTATATGLLLSEVIEPNAQTCNGNNTSCKLETDYGYDAFGNKTSTSTTGLGAVLNGSGQQVFQNTTRTNQSTFDPDGEFPDIVSNSLGESENWNYSESFGMPSSETGPNGLTTTWTYDKFGRKTREHRPDGTETQTTYNYCAGVNGGTFATCPANASFAVQMTPTKNDHATQLGPIAITYYDALYRIIANDVQGFGGQWIRQQTVYDGAGRVSQTSRPYFRDQTGVTIAWTVNNTFDGLGRTTKTTRADGGYTTFTYNGLTAVTTARVIRPDGTASNEPRTTVKNAMGQTVSVTNPNASYYSTYSYDAVGDILTMTDPQGNVISSTYDLRGNKIAQQDPDLGSWSYIYDSFSKLYRQTDAKSQTTTLSYDALGRAIERTESDLVSTWTYGTDPGSFNVDKLIQACANSCAGTDYFRTLTYDGDGRAKTVVLHINGSPGTYTLGYESGTGRLLTLQYPSGLKVQYNYDPTLGYLLGISDYTSGLAYWTATARDAEMHLTQAVAGNGVQTIQIFDPNSGRIQQVRASSDGSDDGSLTNLSYVFDTGGNLATRSDTIGDGTHGYGENFCYDTANRLTSYALNTTYACPQTGGKTVHYDVMGNITNKSDVGGYSYPTPGASSVHPHAVTSISGTLNGIVNPHFDYDAEGNLLCEHTTANCTGSNIVSTIAYTSYNRTSQLMQGVVTIQLGYDTEHQRINQLLLNGGTTTSTTYYNDPVSGAMSEKVTLGTTPTAPSTTWHDYIMADGKMVAERFSSGSSSSVDYFILDHLGSVALITSDGGTAVANGRLSYDAWGRMRNADGTDDPTCSKPGLSPTTRGYTGQEEMPAVCLVNLNARIYDPTLGRFLSADSQINNPYNMQSFNRYSYVGNNPLSISDPTGHGFWDIFVDILAVAIAILVPVAIFGTFAALSSALAAGSLEAIGAVALGGALAGGLQAGLTGGNVLQGILFGGLSGALMAGLVPGLSAEINGALKIGADYAFIGKALAAGFIGGGLSAVEGGRFLSGFLAAGVGSLASFGGAFNAGRALEAAVIGGLASVLGGGKFANGAITAAFAYAIGTIGKKDAAPVQSGGGKTDPVIFVGGAGDASSHIVSDYEQAFAQAHPDLITQYFSWDQRDDIIAYIKGLDPNAAVTLIGHSWGADTAAEVALAMPGRINLLITIDPVSWFSPSYTKLAAATVWIDANSTGGSSFQRSNMIAGLGSSWDDGPQGIASSYIPVNVAHWNFPAMMQAVCSSGLVTQPGC